MIYTYPYARKRPVIFFWIIKVGFYRSPEVFFNIRKVKLEPTESLHQDGRMQQTAIPESRDTCQTRHPRPRGLKRPLPLLRVAARGYSVSKERRPTGLGVGPRPRLLVVQQDRPAPHKKECEARLFVWNVKGKYRECKAAGGNGGKS